MCLHLKKQLEVRNTVVVLYIFLPRQSFRFLIGCCFIRLQQCYSIDEVCKIILKDCTLEFFEMCLQELYGIIGESILQCFYCQQQHHSMRTFVHPCFITFDVTIAKELIVEHDVIRYLFKNC